jgi:hypothetical protein
MDAVLMCDRKSWRGLVWIVVPFPALTELAVFFAYLLLLKFLLSASDPTNRAYLHS